MRAMTIRTMENRTSEVNTGMGQVMRRIFREKRRTDGVQSGLPSGRRNHGRVSFAALFLAAAWSVALVIGLVMPAAVHADSVGPKNPSNGSNNSSIGSTSWSNTSNIKSSDNADARASLSGGRTSNYLVATGFGFSIPSNATITGIKVDIERAEGNRSSSAGIRDNSVKIVKGGSITGTDHANTSANWPTSDQTASYGSSSDLWGQSWSPADINASSFGVALSARNTSSYNSEYADVDNVKITIYYTVPPACTAAAPTVSITSTPKTITTSGGGAEYAKITVTNNDSGSGCADVTFNLSASDSNTTKFDASIVTPLSITIAPGATSVLGDISLIVKSKLGQLSGTNITTLSASAAGHATGSANIVTTLNVVCTLSAPTLELTPATQIISTNGGSGSYTLNILNNDTPYACTANTTFTLSVTDSNSGSFVVPSALSQNSVTLAPGANANITVTVKAKTGVTTGANDTTVSASATGHPSASSNTVTTNIDIAAVCTAGTPMLEIDPSGTVPPGGTATYLVTVTNTDSPSCSAITFTVAVVSDSNPGAFTTPSTLNPLTIILAPGQSDSSVLSVTAKGAAAQGAVNTTVAKVSAAGHVSPANVSVSTTVSSALPPTAAKLVHNSTTTGSTKWSSVGGWGIAGGKYGQFVCTTCHVEEAPNIKRIKGTITVPDTSKGNIPGSTVNFQSTSLAGSFGDDTTAHASSQKICEVCHTLTSVHKYNQPTVVAHESSVSINDCVACHKHSQGFKPVGGCTICHSVPLGNRVAVVGQFSGPSHHIQGTALTDQHCYQCHWEANADGSINSTYHGGSANPGAPVRLVIYGAGSRPTTYAVGTTAVEYSANGQRAELQKINSHCLGCHSGQNNTTQPFGDGKTPRKYAWDSTSVAERYSQAGTTLWGKYSGANVTPKNTQTKAYSAHGNAAANQRGWDLNETWPNTSGTVQVLCFDCHNSHGSSVSGKTTSYTSATPSGGILKDTIANKGGYSVTYKPQVEGSAAGKNLSNPGASLCFDCHMTQNAGTTPWGYQSTFGSSQAILGYWEKPYWTGAAGTNPSGAQMRYAYKNLIGSQGGHFGASSSLNTQPMGTIGGLCTPCHDPHGVSPTLEANQQYGVPLLKGTWMTSPFKEDAAPSSKNVTISVRGEEGAGGTTAASNPGYHIDQNTFSTSWNWSSSTRISQTDAQFAGLCLKCHTKSDINPTTGSATWKSMDRIHNTVKGWGGSGANANNAIHSYTCSKCHAPHNSCLPRLVVTNCLDYSHRVQVGSGGAPNRASGRGEEGSGSGQFPAGGGGSAGRDRGSSQTIGFGSRSCHDNTNSSGWPSNQLWNVKTPWGTPGTPTNIGGRTRGGR